MKPKLENRFLKSDSKKTKPETEIQKFMKPKIENQFFKIRIRNKKYLERKLENRFAKSDSKKEI